MASKMVMCDLCSRLNKSAEGLKYCTECEYALCTDCTAIHSVIEKTVNISGGVITCITVTIDNELLICNHETKVISLISETGQHLKSCSVPDCRIWGITLIPGTDEAVVTLPDNRLIQLFNVTSFTLGKQIGVDVNPYSVAVVKDNVILGSNTGEVVFMERESGKCLKTLKVGSGQILSIVPGVDDKDELLYCCEYKGGNMVICVKMDGTKKFSQPFKGPLDLALDLKGNSYVTVFFSSELHRLSSNGQVDDILLRTSEGFDGPLAVAFNKTFEKLYISSRGPVNKGVLVFNCK